MRGRCDIGLVNALRREVAEIKTSYIAETRSRPRIWKWHRIRRRDQNLVHRDKARGKGPPDVKGIEAGACNGISQTSKNEVDTFS